MRVAAAWIAVPKLRIFTILRRSITNEIWNMSFKPQNPRNWGLVIFYHFCDRIRNFGLVPFLRARKGSQHIDYSSTRRTSIQSGSGPLPLEMNAHARSFIHQSPPQFATPWAAATCHFLYKSKSRSDRKGNDCYLSTSFNVLSQTFFFSLTNET